ncbi:MAG TPA: hypothetical protein PKC94_17885, partial [Leptospiraceae bacterium]|nr:hypothetical protein [Leptospiraceae bacterium]
DSDKQKQALIEKPIDAAENIRCKLCPKKIAGIRNYIHKGNKPVLVLHYTGEFRKGQPSLSKTNPSLALRTRDSEDLFDRLIKKVFNFSSKEFFFQEYPACSFNHNTSTLADWKTRMEACDLHVKNTILANNIKGIILMGSAAVMRLGAEQAKEKTGKLEPLSFQEVEIPTLVIRSPEGVFSLEEKRKKLEHNKTSEGYKLAKKEEDEVKIGLVEHLTLFKNKIGII